MMLVASERAQRSSPATPSTPSSPARLAAKKVSVMVIDDDVDIREILSEILADAGYSVVTAANGAEAIAMLKTVTPSLILLDLNMPVMDGVEFRQRQRQDPATARIPTVVMSAVHQMQDRIAGLGVDDALAKPVDLARLLQVVAHHCERPF